MHALNLVKVRTTTKIVPRDLIQMCHSCDFRAGELRKRVKVGSIDGLNRERNNDVENEGNANGLQFLMLNNVQQFSWPTHGTRARNHIQMSRWLERYSSDQEHDDIPDRPLHSAKYGRRRFRRSVAANEFDHFSYMSPNLSSLICKLGCLAVFARDGRTSLLSWTFVLDQLVHL